MDKYSAANKRIAKNTMLMYINLFVTMVIGLYTSRVVLRILFSLTCPLSPLQLFLWIQNELNT